MIAALASPAARTPGRARWLVGAAYAASLLAFVPIVPYLNERAQKSAGAAHLLHYGPCYLLALVHAWAFVADRKRLTLPRGVALSLSAIASGVLLYLLDDPPIERIHVPEYGLLALFFLRAMAGRRAVAVSSLAAWLLASLVGVLDEAIQLFLPSRIFDWRDISSNAASAAVGVAFALGRGWADPPQANP